MSEAAARAFRPPRLTRSVRSPEVTASKGAFRIRRALALIFAAYGLFLSFGAIANGGIPAWPHAVMVMMAVTLFTGRGGTFVRDWVPVILGFLAYTQAAQLAERLHLSVHYLPQIEADRLLGLGTTPTQWLQDRLYSGRTGVLEVAALVAYASHFFVPLGVAFYVWWSRGRETFNTLILGLLAVSLLGEITYVLAPTAPPWLAAENGHLPHVHQILKQALVSLHLDTAAVLKGDAHAYNIAAAIPSLHVAWPVIGLLALRTYRLPRWIIVVQATQLAAVVFTIVYTGEHYVVDALAGALYAVVAWRLVQWALRDGTEKTASRLGAIRVSRLTSLAGDEGQALFEYAAVISLVSIVSLTLLTAIGGIVNVNLTQIANAL